MDSSCMHSMTSLTSGSRDIDASIVVKQRICHRRVQSETRLSSTSTVTDASTETGPSRLKNLATRLIKLHRRIDAGSESVPV
jgi:hypothetical protein